jgi:hypothetical protein
LADRRTPKKGYRARTLDAIFMFKCELGMTVGWEWEPEIAGDLEALRDVVFGRCSV